MTARLGLSFCLALALFGLGASGCAKTIGDACKANVECSPLGDRFCDLASPGGYCTVEGCDNTSCPDSSSCVRFFSLRRADATCTAGLTPDPACLDSSCCKPGMPGCCRLGERCLCDDDNCAKAYCASESTERRWCMKPCDDNSDCRDGYVCQTTGAAGALAVATRNEDQSVSLPVLKFCAPPRK